jgi:hypothetical protein
MFKPLEIEDMLLSYRCQGAKPLAEPQRDEIMVAGMPHLSTGFLATE